MIRFSALCLVAAFGFGLAAARAQDPAMASPAPIRAFAKDQYFLRILKTEETIRVDSVCFTGDTAYFRDRRSDRLSYLPLGEVDFIRRDASGDGATGMLVGGLITGGAVLGVYLLGKDEEADRGGYRGIVYLLVGALVVPLGMGYGGLAAEIQGRRVFFEFEKPERHLAARENWACSRFAPGAGPESKAPVNLTMALDTTGVPAVPAVASFPAKAINLAPQVQEQFEAEKGLKLPISINRLSATFGRGTSIQNQSAYWEFIRAGYQLILYTHKGVSLEAGLGYVMTRGQEDWFENPETEYGAVLSLGRVDHGRNGLGFSMRTRFDYYLDTSRHFSGNLGMTVGIDYRLGKHSYLLAEGFQRLGYMALGLRFGYSVGF